jgi:hypothetical protein
MKPSTAKKNRMESAQALHPKFQRILVAVDLSEESRSALACAAELAAKFDASLTLGACGGAALRSAGHGCAAVDGRGDRMRQNLRKPNWS